MNQLEQIKQIAEDVANEYKMPSIASGVYLDFAVNVAKIYGDIQYSLAYKAGQEAERERLVTGIKDIVLKNLYTKKRLGTKIKGIEQKLDNTYQKLQTLK